jgi:hypothetical protein
LDLNEYKTLFPSGQAHTAEKAPSNAQRPETQLDQVRDVIHLKQCAIRTEQ